MSYKKVKPQFTAETLISAIPESIVSMHNLVVLNDELHIGYSELKISNDRVVNNSTHIVNLKLITEVVISDTLVWLHFDNYGVANVRFSRSDDRVYFTLTDLINL